MKCCVIVSANEREPFNACFVYISVGAASVRPTRNWRLVPTMAPFAFGTLYAVSRSPFSEVLPRVWPFNDPNLMYYSLLLLALKNRPRRRRQVRRLASVQKSGSFGQQGQPTARQTVGPSIWTGVDDAVIETDYQCWYSPHSLVSLYFYM